MTAPPDEHEGVMALNYSAHAIEDMSYLCAHMAKPYPKSASAIAALVDLLRGAVKFILPNCGQLLDVASVGQAHLDLLKLPFPVIALEVPWRSEKITDEIAGMRQSLSTRRIALCWELDATPPSLQQLTVVRNQFPEGGAFVVPIVWIDAQARWLPWTGGIFLPYNNRFAPVDLSSGNDLSVRVYESLRDAGLAGKKAQRFDAEPFILQPEVFEQTFGHDRKAGFLAISNDARDETQTLIQACAVLNCENVQTAEITPNPKLNKARAAKGKQPFFSYKVLTLSGERESGAGDPGSGSHSSPRMHLRRGHIRRLQHKTVWVRNTIVGGDNAGRVDKSYVLKR